MTATIPHREELFDLYRLSIEEYRFQVNLNWDRTKHFFTLNAAILAVGAGLVRVDASPLGVHLAGLLFLFGAFAAGWGASATVRSHKYYRRAVFKKTLLARELGLLDTIGSSTHPDATPDVAGLVGTKKQSSILADPDDYLEGPLRPETITHSTSLILGVFVLLDLYAAMYTFLKS